MLLSIFILLLITLLALCLVNILVKKKPEEYHQTTIEPWELDDISRRKDTECIKALTRLLGVSENISFKALEVHCRETADFNISSFSVYYVLKERCYRHSTTFEQQLKKVSLQDLNLISEFSDIEKLCFKYDPSFGSYLKVKFKSIIDKE